MLNKWIEALESGKYNQCLGVLHNGTGYCCLGVLCVVAGETFAKIDDDLYVVKNKEWRERIPGDEFTKLTGLKANDQQHLIDLNDDCETFEDIAKVLRTL